MCCYSRDTSDATNLRVASLQDLVGADKYSGDPAKTKIKGFARMKEKQEDKYTHTEFAMPSCAVMCDVVRCLVECTDADDMVDTFNLICDNMKVGTTAPVPSARSACAVFISCVWVLRCCPGQVLRVKNGFAEKEVPFGFRQVRHQCSPRSACGRSTRRARHDSLTSALPPLDPYERVVHDSAYS